MSRITLHIETLPDLFFYMHIVSFVFHVPVIWYQPAAVGNVVAVKGEHFLFRVTTGQKYQKRGEEFWPLALVLQVRSFCTNRKFLCFWSGFVEAIQSLFVNQIPMCCGRTCNCFF